MTDKILKGCNCCRSSNRSVKSMTYRARIAYCRNCKARTVWDALTTEEAQAHIGARNERAAFLQRLCDEMDAGAL